MILLPPFYLFYFIFFVISLKLFAGNSFYPDTAVIKCGFHTPWLVVVGVLMLLDFSCDFTQFVLNFLPSG